MPATSEWDKKHQRNLSSYEREVDAMFDTAVKEAARIADIIRELKGEKPFSFDDYPEAKKRVNNLLERLTRNVTTSVVSGIRSEWTLANEKNNELCNRVFGDKVDDLTEAQRRQYYTTNSKARQAFEQRRVNGLSLSDRVWNYTSQFKEEIEWGLDIGLREGRSAAEMARDLKQYLKYPDKLFRRVRDEHGNLRLSRNAKAFHPGMGVYRSSYKNARRLAVTETNMAYRTSDYERWQKLDFVVGMHIIRSNNHTTTDSKGKRVKLVDICDELSGENERDTKGRYPKSFKFTGWHPQCRCYAVSILKTEEERREDRRRRLAGEEPLPASSSVNYVGDVPQEFKKWVADNSERINNTKSLPYFISDNRNVVDGILYGENSTEEGVYAKTMAASKTKLSKQDEEFLAAAEKMYAGARSLFDEFQGQGLTAEGLLMAVEDYVSRIEDMARLPIEQQREIIEEQISYLRSASYPSAKAELRMYEQKLAQMGGEKQKAPEREMNAIEKENISKAEKNFSNARDLFNEGFDSHDIYYAAQDYGWSIEKMKSLSREEQIQRLEELIEERGKLGGAVPKVETRMYEQALRDLRNGKNLTANMQATGEQTSTQNMPNVEYKTNRLQPRANALRGDVEYNAVGLHDRELTQEEIISRLAGGDLTEGSCASLAFAYAGNRAGFDVLDFRGGKSADRIALSARDVCIELGAKGVNHDNNPEVSSLLALQQVQTGKEYIFIAGQHAAIVRRRKDDDMFVQYLELQSESGGRFEWLSNEKLCSRFSVDKVKYATAWLLDIDALKADAGFREWLGFINTDKSRQQKGAGGAIR